MVFLFKVWPWNKLKGLDAFNVIKLKCEVISFTGEFMGDNYVPSAFAVKKNSWRGIFEKFLFCFWAMRIKLITLWILSGLRCVWQRSLNMVNLSVIFLGEIL